MTTPDSGAVPLSRLPEVAIDLPEGWVARTDVADVVLAAYMANWLGEHTPTIAVTFATIERDLSVETYLAEQVRGASLTDAVLVDVGFDAEARTVDLLVAHDLDGRALTVRQHHVVGRDGWAVGSCAMVAETDWPVLADEVTAALESLRFTA